jgi:3-deoxy-manno-octulosonate cytidylyltransferase (CMP-KDO synthetase)
LSSLKSCNVWDNANLGECLVMRKNPKILGVIPARFDSQRLPGKVLLRIGAKPMIHWVYDRARQSKLMSDLLVATDSDEVQEYCSNNSMPVMRTGRHASGSDRLHEVMEKTDADIYVNIQGDEPTVRPEHIEMLLKPLLSGQGEVTTLKVEIDRASAQNPNIVKVVTDIHDHAIYSSRFPIPFDRDASGAIHFYKHIGLYGYTREALALFHSLHQSSLELAEKLEQLRYLENGISIYVSETPYDTIGVDTEEDLILAASLLTTGG